MPYSTKKRVSNLKKRNVSRKKNLSMRSKTRKVGQRSRKMKRTMKGGNKYLNNFIQKTKNAAYITLDAAKGKLPITHGGFCSPDKKNVLSEIDAETFNKIEKARSTSNMNYIDTLNYVVTNYYNKLEAIPFSIARKFFYVCKGGVIFKRMLSTTLKTEHNLSGNKTSKILEKPANGQCKHNCWRRISSLKSLPPFRKKVKHAFVNLLLKVKKTEIEEELQKNKNTNTLNKKQIKELADKHAAYICDLSSLEHNDKEQYETLILHYKTNNTHFRTAYTVADPANRIRFTTNFLLKYPAILNKFESILLQKP